MKNRPAPPLAAAATLTRAYHVLLERRAEWIRTHVLDQWHTNARAVGPRHRANRLDAAPWIEAKLRLLVAEHEGDTHTLEPTIDLVAGQLVRKSKKDLQALMPVKLKDHPGLGEKEVAIFREANLTKIESLTDAQVEELRDILEEGADEGWKIEKIRSQVEDRIGVSKSKAELLARDQTAKLNGQLARVRQTQAGIEEYEWSTSGDERVREMHQELDGTRQSWDDPPVVNDDGDTGHPGDDYQCRCVAIPVLPDIGDLESDDEPDEEDEEG